MTMDAFQLALVAEVARRNGQEDTAKHFDKMCEDKVRKDVAANREWRRRLERSW